MTKIWYKNTCPFCFHQEESKPFDWCKKDRCEFNERPHQDPFKCIYHLKNLVFNLIDRVESLEHSRDYNDEY